MTVRYEPGRRYPVVITLGGVDHAVDERTARQLARDIINAVVEPEPFTPVRCAGGCSFVRVEGRWHCIPCDGPVPG